MRALIATAVALLLLAAGVASAAETVRQSGTSSQRRPVALVTSGDRVSRYVITWTARCPGTRYTGSSDLSKLALRPDGTFRARLRYTHKVDGGRTAHVDVTVAGTVAPGGKRASGTFRGSARIDRLGTCRSGGITWKTRASAD